LSELVNTLLKLEEDPNLHAARLLLLIKAFAGKKGINKIRGLTKVVKLDFLLRYPVYFERALKQIGVSPDSIYLHDHERRSVESSMIRYRYGPWDPRYRAFINFLVVKGLVEVGVEVNTIIIGLTPKGFAYANDLASKLEFEDFVSRAKVLVKYFDWGGTNLKKFLYDTFPEILSFEMGETIT
jgi:hypothetical protein